MTDTAQTAGFMIMIREEVFMKSKYAKVVITVWVVSRGCFNDERLVADREIPTGIIPDDAGTFDFFTDFRKLNENDRRDYGESAKNIRITAISDEQISYIENGKEGTCSADSTLYFVVDYDKSSLLSYQFALYYK